MNKLIVWLLGALVFVSIWSGVAYAAGVVDPQDGTLDLAKAIHDAFAGGHYAYCAALAIILMVALVKRYIVPREHWLQEYAGSTALTLVGASATALASSLAGGGPITGALIESSLLVGVGAAGGYTVVKKLLIQPVIAPLQDKLPVWAKPIFSTVMWIFDRPPTAAQAEATAQTAGMTAVVNDPPKGADGITGKPTEIK
jgi:hypothetical protein